jgi:hypothetical protein
MMPHDFRLLPNGVVNKRLHALGIHRAKKSGEVLRLLRFFFCQICAESRVAGNQENRVRKNFLLFLGRMGVVKYNKKMRYDGVRAPTIRWKY